MITIRPVRLPDEVPGKLFLSAMPGRHRPIEDDQADWAACDIDLVVCLNAPAEIQDKSPDYAAAIEAGALQVERVSYVIQDFDVPGNREEYLTFVEGLASRLKNGDHIVVHCAGGIGRTGMTAVSVLCCLGMARSEAEARVWEAGARPENALQKEVCRWIGERV